MIKEIILNIMFSVMHLCSYSNFSRKRFFTPMPKMSKDPIENHLQVDYYCIHGNKKPLKLYKKGKLLNAIRENIKSYPKECSPNTTEKS